MFRAHPIDTLHVNTNYAWAIVPEGSKNAFIVDPGEAPAVLSWLEQRALTLAGILITHQHWDHINGMAPLLETRQVPVWGPDIGALPPHARTVGEGDKIRLENLDLDVMAIPGHTADHIAYYCVDGPAPALFCGDTLFAAGCGRVFDGTAEQLWTSLNRLSQLPANTQIFCAHEYTLTNLAFAQAVEPDNTHIAARLEQVKQQRENGTPSLPSQLDQEWKTNPFLRCHEPRIIASANRHAGRELQPGLAVFAELRRWKDNF